MRGSAEAGDHTEDWCSLVGAVVEHGEREVEVVRRLADGEHLLTRLRQDSPGALRERLAAKARKRLRRAEALRRSADEQHACRRYAIRHGSV